MDTKADIHPPAQLIRQVEQAFKERFDGAPRLFSAPGRINIVGEHTDYSEGWVLPAAIDRFCVTAIRPNQSGAIRVLSLNHGDVSLARQFERRGDWADYPAGVSAVLAAAGVDIPGCDVVIGSDVPEGAGVSSSAALEVSFAAALLGAAGHDATPFQIARWCQRAENDYVGMPCGIMDQYISAGGVSGHALQIDCRALSHTAIEIPPGLAFLVIDSLVRHQLVDGGYAARRADCETAARALGVTVLRDADIDMVTSGDLDERVRNRALHVVQENARVFETSEALRRNEPDLAGDLMNQSHESLQTLFEVTCPETDALAALSRQVEGVYGARQMGGGFGGAVLALVDAPSAHAAQEEIVRRYEAAAGLRTSGFACRIAGGVRGLSH